MSSMQIVLLFDLSVCKDYLFKPKEELNKKLLSIRLACLRLLTDFSSRSPNLKWGFKFFDSDGPKTQNMCKFACSDVSLEKFETLENEICVRYERHLSFLQALVETAQKSETSSSNGSEREMATDSPVKILQFALTQILCEFQWETMDMWSPSVKKIRAITAVKRNYLFVLSDFKDNDEFLFKYFGLNSCLSKFKFLNTFLPQSLREPLVKKSDIHLVFLNTCLYQKFMGSFTSTILPLLSHSLQAVQGSLIPLSILSQPLYNMKFFNAKEESKVSPIPNLYSSYRNSVIPFSSLFEQSLDQPFYSSENTSIYKCYLDYTNNHVPVQLMEVFKKKSNLNKDSTFVKILEDKKMTWSNFVVSFAVSRNFHYAAYEVLLCLPDRIVSTSAESINLVNINNKMCLGGFNLVLECVTKCGIKMPGLLTPLSNDASLISILDPSVNYLMFEPHCKIPTSDSLKDADQNYSNKIQNFTTELKNFSDADKAESLSDTALKPFFMECLEPWFKPTPVVSRVAADIESKSSNNSLKMDSYWKLLKQSVKNSKSLSEKLSKTRLSNGAESNAGENFADSEAQNIEEEFPDLSHEELLSAVRESYNSAIESSGNIVTSSKRIVNMMVNYCKKHSNTSVEDDVNNIFKDNFFMTARRISEKYEMLDSQEATEQKMKECQIQVLLVLGIENLRTRPDRANCVNTVTSLLRVMIFYSGIKELKIFLDVIKKGYNNLYDILVEIGDELNISIFDDAESTNSPADTLSSELNNDDEAFNSVVSSVVSEKSTSSTSSRKGNKDSNLTERKLIRHRSDISDTSKYRQVLLPRSSPKKKKEKTAVSKAVRYSPRIAAQKNEHARDKPSKVRRNLFSGEAFNHTPKKLYQPSTPKSKKKNLVLKSRYVSDTPSHNQNHSALQRRKSDLDQLLKSPKEIAESPKIMKTAKDGACKELLEKCQKASQESLKPTNIVKKEKIDSLTIKEYTPESKRRLSLKLFSKLLTSPTARMGIKKCTKRLFDEISPQKAVDNNKRHKPNNESELPSSSTKQQNMFKLVLSNH